MGAGLDEKGRPRPPVLFRLITVFGFLLLYVPLAVLVVYSFVDAPAASGSAAATAATSRWTLKWYGAVFHNDILIEALVRSLWIGLWASVGSTVIGTLAALALERGRLPGRKVIEGVILLPLITPEIVLGLSLLVWFVILRLTLGTFSIIIAHITFSISYVIVTVRARLHDFDPVLEEAAHDLGANAWQTFWRVTLPLIFPGVLSGALMAFTLSFDDFLVTFFTAGVGSDTLPLKLYAMIKYGVSPEVNALSTLLLIATFVFVFTLFRPWKRAGSPI